MDDIKVTVVQFGDREHLQMQYRDPITGKKKTRSTKTSNRREAEREAAKWEDDLRKGRAHDGGKMTWSDFRERYESEYLTSLAEKTDKKVSTVFNTVERIIGPAKLRDVTAQRISGLMAKLREEGRAESTIKGHVTHLMSALRWGVDMGLIPAVPKVQMPRRAKGTNVMKGRPITGEEFERMLAAVPKALKGDSTGRRKRDVPDVSTVESWRHHLRGLWTSGLRLTESLELCWDREDKLRVDLAGKRPMLRIPAELEKGHKDRMLPIAPEFAEFLLETPPEARKGYVFRPMARRRMVGREGRLCHDTVINVIVRIGKTAGVKVRSDAKSGKVKYASAHDLRRAFGERWASRVMPQTLMELMRHESIDTTMRYYVGRNAHATAEILWAAHDALVGNKTSNKASEAPNDPDTQSSQVSADQAV